MRHRRARRVLRRVRRRRLRRPRGRRPGGKLDAAALRREPVALARRCEDLLAEHEEHVAVLYSYRSVSKAIPYYAGEEEARVRGLIVATLGDALAPVLDAMRFADRAVEFCVEAADRALDGGCGALDVETFAAAADAVFTLDLLKDMKAFFPATLTQDIKRLQQAMPDGWPATGEANAGPLSASDFEELTEALVVHHDEDSTIRSYQGRLARRLREDLAFAAPRADALLLRDLRRAAADEYYWKLTHPSISGLEDGSAHDKRTVPFAAALLHNYSGREKSVLVDAICLAKSLAQTLADAAPGSRTSARPTCGASAGI
ncbi:hypothetical protein JL722_13881 [Aureococcus anophagefferens]|nr:hypothetical protein JL722_13881 [Aureococcus anophagefferens]